MKNSFKWAFNSQVGVHWEINEKLQDRDNSWISVLWEGDKFDCMLMGKGKIYLRAGRMT